jgi:hypothetical protein
MTAVPLEVDIRTCSSAILDNLKTFTTYTEEAALRNTVIYNCCVFLPISCTGHVTLMLQAAPTLTNTYIPEALHTTSLNSNCYAYSDSGFVKHVVPLGSTLSSALFLIHIIDLSHMSMHGLNLYILLILLSLYTTLTGTTFKIPFIMGLPKYPYITFDTILFMKYAMNNKIRIKLNIGYGNKTVIAQTTKVFSSSSSSSSHGLQDFRPCDL